MITIFLDTNIFLHYLPIEQINWTSIVQSKDVSIVIPPITIRELNKQKEIHPHKRIRARAQRNIQYLSSLFNSSDRALLQDGVEIKLESIDPNIDYDLLQLNKEINDDIFIGNIYYYQVNHPNNDVVLVTSDLGLSLISKSRRFGYSVINISEDYKLPEEPDQQEIEELKKQLHEYTSRIPILSLIYSNGNQHEKFLLSRPNNLSEDDINKRLNDIRIKFPKMNKKQKDNYDSIKSVEAQAKFSSTLDSVLGTIQPDDIDEYNAKLDLYYDTYKNFIISENDFINSNLRTIELVFLLANDGTAPAEDIDILLKFPDGFELFSKDNFRSRPNPPNPPEKPVTPLEKSLNFPFISDYPIQVPTVVDPVLPPSNVSSPSIKRVNSFEVEIHVDRLKHKFKETLEPLYVQYESYTKAHSFKIEYSILASDTPREIEGYLHIVIDK